MAENWQRIEEIVARALELPPEKRPELLEEIKRQDPRLARDAGELLEACEEASKAPPILLEQEDPPEHKVDSSIGRYRLLRKLGTGGMASVFLAERTDGEFEHSVAVKILRRELGDGPFVQRFEAERQILARLRHRHIARLFDGGQTPSGQPFIVMDRIDGLPIDRYCESRSLTIPQRLKLLRQVCEAVHYAHQNLVVHRDLKPSNILVNTAGEPFLLDFGIAKLLDATTLVGQESTATEWRAATPSYSSPEQLRGEPITTASDVYSLGVLLYRLLTGDVPFGPDAARWLVAKIEDEPITPPSRSFDAARLVEDQRTARRRLRGDLDSIVSKALRPEPTLRYASAEQLGEDLDRFLDGRAVHARPGTFVYRATKAVRRNKKATAMAVGVFLLCLAFGLSMSLQAQALACARDRAQAQRDRAEGVSEFLVDMFRISHPKDSKVSSVSSKKLLDFATKRIFNETADKPMIKADLLETVGRVYHSFGHTEEAGALLRVAYGLRIDLLGETSAETAENLRFLAMVAQDEGRFQEALDLVRRARDVHRQTDTSGELLAADLLLEAQIFAIVDHSVAEGLFQEALTLFEQSVGVRSWQVAATLSGLGASLSVLGKTSEAKTALSRSLDIFHSLFGLRHPYVISTMNSLTRVLLEQRRYEECEEMARATLWILQEAVPKSHKEIRVSLNQLGLCLEGQEVKRI